jgi:hypothetical protein
MNFPSVQLVIDITDGRMSLKHPFACPEPFYLQISNWKIYSSIAIDLLT